MLFPGGPDNKLSRPPLHLFSWMKSDPDGGFISDKFEMKQPHPDLVYCRCRGTACRAPTVSGCPYVGLRSLALANPTYRGARRTEGEGRRGRPMCLPDFLRDQTGWKPVPLRRKNPAGATAPVPAFCDSPPFYSTSAREGRGEGYHAPSPFWVRSQSVCTSSISFLAWSN